MDKLYEELFRVDESVPQAEICGDVSGSDRTGQTIFVLCTIMDKGENGQITISELGMRRAKMLPSGDFQNFKRVRRARICGAEYQ